MKIFLTALLLIVSSSIFGQQRYYKMPNGKIIDSATYERVKENLSKNGKVDEIIISKVKRNDSLIITPKITVLTQKDKDGNYVDPYGEQKKLIGTRFPIEIFKENNGGKYSKKLLEGKPTLVNFWFTSCVPCVAEIPILNSMKGESGNKFNFVAITFENEKVVNAFLKKMNFSSFHISNSKSGIDYLKIVAYPTNLILDKTGTVIDVYGEITRSQTQILKTLNDLL